MSTETKARGRGDRSDGGSLLQRQWAVLQMLPRAPKFIETTTLAARLSGEHGITVLPRTLQRELMALTAIFPIGVDEGARPYRWFWLANAPSLSLPVLDARAAVLLLLVERYLRAALPPALSVSLGPLVEVAQQSLSDEKNKLGHWLRSVRVISRHLALDPPSIEPSVLLALSESLLEQRTLRLTYRGKKPGEKLLVLHPLGLVLKDGVGYVVGVVEGYSDVRLFALHRAMHAEVLTGPRLVPDGFDLDDYIASGHLGYRLGATVEVIKVRFSRDVARNLTETTLAPAQAIETADDGSITLTARVPITQQLRSWLQGFGEHAEVLEPSALRNWFAETATRLAAMYTTSPAGAANDSTGAANGT